MPLRLAILGLLLVTPCLAAQTEAPAKARFDRTIAPLLAEHCLDCHSGRRPKGGLDLTRPKAVRQGGKSGSAVVPGKLQESVLWERVRLGEMPPKQPLADKDKELLKQWILAGAVWGTEPLDLFQWTTSKRAGLDWWALQPVKRPALPTVKDTRWARNPIDAFVLARLEAKGLKPSPAADRRTLIRRLSCDLIGLPPTPEEVAAFVSDKHPDAYEKLVDRLLASPHYGERWARHWLDVVRFGESDGFERNAARQNAWPYRDWVIKAVNADMAYDEFCRLQIAGDVLRPGDGEALQATGFLVAGIHNTVIPLNKTAQETARQDELEDLIASVGQTFLGLTVNCGRCHDHKFDPITQQDYYRFAAALGGVNHGERDLPMPQLTADSTKRAGEEKRLQEALAHLEEPARQALLAAKKTSTKQVPPAPLAGWDFRRDLKDQVGELHLSLEGGAQRTAAGLVLNGKTAFARSVPLKNALREKTLEAWARLDNLQQRGGGVMTVQAQDGNVFDAIVFGEKEPGGWLAGSDFFRRTNSFHGPSETEAAARPVHLAIVYRADGTIAGYRDGKQYGKPYKSKGPVVFEAGKAVVAFGVRHAPAGGNRMLAGTIVQARLYDRALTPDEVAASAAGTPFITESELLARLTPEQRQKRGNLLAQLSDLAQKRAALMPRNKQKLYAVISKPPPSTRLLVRGQVAEPAETITSGGIAALKPLAFDFGLADNAPDAERRRKLAAWITHAENPLFARVMVNRLWHYHFGTGLVETPSDFGFNGSRASHPELLNWLAAEFMRPSPPSPRATKEPAGLPTQAPSSPAGLGVRAWSMKALHRLIVTSNAYRQASKPRPECLKIDADNRLLWRKKPQRMEGEVLRDSLLVVAGLLNREVGGRGFSDYKEVSGAGTSYWHPFDPVGPAFHRRSIYRFQPRGGNQGLLDVFDCPDPAAAAPRRSATTTPLQALALWNGAFGLRMADAMAERIRKEHAGSVMDQVNRAYRLALQRDATEDETTAARLLVERHGLRALCRALFNLNEFVMVD